MKKAVWRTGGDLKACRPGARSSAGGASASRVAEGMINGRMLVKR